MQFTILNAQGMREAALEASSLDAASLTWGNKCWEESVVREALTNMSRYPLPGGGEGGFLDPYLLAPAGQEEECLALHRRQRKEDPHFAPDPVASSDPRTIDTGGRQE